jgi:hypothetical protein
VSWIILSLFLLVLLSDKRGRALHMPAPQHRGPVLEQKTRPEVVITIRIEAAVEQCAAPKNVGAGDDMRNAADALAGLQSLL